MPSLSDHRKLDSCAQIAHPLGLVLGKVVAATAAYEESRGAQRTEHFRRIQGASCGDRLDHRRRQEAPSEFPVVAPFDICMKESREHWIGGKLAHEERLCAIA